MRGNLQQLPDAVIPFDPNSQRLVDAPPVVTFDDDVSPPATGTIQRAYQAEALTPEEIAARAKHQTVADLETEARKVAKKLKA